MAVGSMATGIAGSVMQGVSSAETADYNAGVARNQQIIANRNASLALQQGTVQEENQRIQTGERIAGAEAQQAASGVNPNSGSALDVRSSAAETGELDALTIRNKANLASYDYRVQAMNYGAQASLYSAEGDWGVMNSILGGASSVSDKWWTYNRYGFGSSNPFWTTQNPGVPGPEGPMG